MNTSPKSVVSNNAVHEDLDLDLFNEDHKCLREDNKRLREEFKCLASEFEEFKQKSDSSTSGNTFNNCVFITCDFGENTGPFQFNVDAEIHQQHILFNIEWKSEMSIPHIR